MIDHHLLHFSTSKTKIQTKNSPRVLRRPFILCTGAIANSTRSIITIKYRKYCYCYLHNVQNYNVLVRRLIVDISLNRTFCYVSRELNRTFCSTASLSTVTLSVILSCNEILAWSTMEGINTQQGKEICENEN